MTARQQLLLLPGLLCDKELWKGQIDRLEDAADISVGDMTTAETMVGLASNILDRAPQLFALAGFSMGGYCALEILVQAPERVSRLALVDTSARADTDEQASHRNWLIDLCQNAGLDAVVDELLPRFLHPEHLNDEALLTRFRAMARRIGASNFVRQQRAIMSRQDRRELLPRIDCPVTIIYGKDDRLTPPELSEEMADAISGAACIGIENSGHFLPLEAADAVAHYLVGWMGDAPGSPVHKSER